MKIIEEKEDIEYKTRHTNNWNVEAIKADIMSALEAAKKKKYKSIKFSAREFWKEYNESGAEYRGDRNQIYHGIRKIIEKVTGKATSSEKIGEEMYIKVSVDKEGTIFKKSKEEKKEKKE